MDVYSESVQLADVVYNAIRRRTGRKDPIMVKRTRRVRCEDRHCSYKWHTEVRIEDPMDSRFDEWIPMEDATLVDMGTWERKKGVTYSRRIAGNTD